MCDEFVFFFFLKVKVFLKPSCRNSVVCEAKINRLNGKIIRNQSFVGKRLKKSALKCNAVKIGIKNKQNLFWVKSLWDGTTTTIFFQKLVLQLKYFYLFNFYGTDGAINMFRNLLKFQFNNTAVRSWWYIPFVDQIPQIHFFWGKKKKFRFNVA